MPNRIDLTSVPERLGEVGQRIAQGKRTHLAHVSGIIRIDKGTERHEKIARADLFLAEGAGAGAVVDFAGVMVFVDNQHRHEAVVGVGRANCYRPSVEIEHPFRIEGVAIGADTRAFRVAGRASGRPCRSRHGSRTT